VIPWRATTIAITAAAAAVAGCGGGPAKPSPPAATPRAPATPALCAPLRSRVVGHVSAVSEASGLVLSGGLLWTHDDSGGPAMLFGLSTRGRLVRELALPRNVDWEDVAARDGTLYVGDIGDNSASRPSIAVYRGAERLDLRYPDGPRDAEALLVDGPRLVIITKSFSGDAGIYAARGAGTLRRAGRLSLGLGEAVTGADSAGRTIVVRTYDSVYVWTRRRGETITHALRRQPCRAGASLIGEGQGESIALARDGRSFWTLPEGANPALRRYEVSRH
jgi:hypothetical protein